jgi:hypothetical protein
MLHTGRKFAPLYIGPYPIKRVLRNSVELDLPTTMRAHNVVNIRYVRPFLADGSFGRPLEPPPIIIDGDHHFKPEVIKAYNPRKVGGRRKHLYLVKWRGYTDSYNRWMAVQDLHLCRELVDEFWARQNKNPPRGAVLKD